MNIEDLESQIRYYSMKYYTGDPQISDMEFDMLVDQLRKVKPDSDVLKTGWGFEVNGDKVKHKYSHIGSLDKCKNFNEIPDRFKGKTVFISPKLDGLSAVVYYENGILTKAITRGNGEYGKDITDKISIIIGKDISDKKFTGAVRGELIISDSNWELLQRKYVDLIAPRNFAAGIINRKDIDEDIKYIDLVVYKIVGQENRPILSERSEMLAWLSLNFNHYIPNYYYPVLNESSWETYHEDTFKEFRNYGYGLDGLVLSDAEIPYNTQTKGFVYNEVAFKFASETATTTITNINWELSRTQRLIPVAEVEPIELSGAIIRNATCNNAQWVQTLGLGKGAEISITRSNEVIPKILEVINISNDPLPDKCPICNSKLEWDGVDLKCNNLNCPNIDYADLEHWCTIIGETDGLQYTIMKQYLDIYNIKTLEDLYNKDIQIRIMDDLNCRKLSITEEKIKLFFEKLYFEKCNINKVLTALNIPRLGDKTSQILGSYPDIVYELLFYSINRLNGINETNLYVKLDKELRELIKDANTESLLSNYKKISHLKYLYLYNNINNKESRIIFNELKIEQEIKYIAVTGSLVSMKRKDFEEYIGKYGYELSSNLKKCQYLVNNDINSTSTKNKQAKELGVPIITEEEFLKLL